MNRKHGAKTAYDKTCVQGCLTRKNQVLCARRSLDGRARLNLTRPAADKGNRIDRDN